MDLNTLKLLFKLASEGESTHRQVGNWLIERHIPVISSLPDAPEAARARLEARIDKADPGRWTHGQVAVPRGELNLPQMGFKETRMAIPLPGEAWGTPTWRSGELHAHKVGPFYLVHKDEAGPDSVLGTLKHLAKDTPKPLYKRIFEKLEAPIHRKGLGLTLFCQYKKVLMVAFSARVRGPLCRSD